MNAQLIEMSKVIEQNAKLAEAAKAATSATLSHAAEGPIGTLSPERIVTMRFSSDAAARAYLDALAATTAKPASAPTVPPIEGARFSPVTTAITGI